MGQPSTSDRVGLPRSALLPIHQRLSRRSLRLSGSLLLLGIVLLLALPAIGDAPQSFFSQTASKLLDHDFPDSNLSYLMLEVQSGTVVAQRWKDPDAPLAIASLVKPFTALAYASSGAEFPTYYCSGHSVCWLPRGHGRLDRSHAIANSCNAYFGQLAKQVAPEAAEATMRQFHLASITPWPVASVLAGLDSGWKNTPSAMAHAYLALYRMRDQSEAKPVIEGMRLSAEVGTGRAVGAALPMSGALVKTGTAPCIHHPHSPGDGFAVVLAPSDSARVILLVRVHGVPGSHAA